MTPASDTPQPDFIVDAYTLDEIERLLNMPEHAWDDSDYDAKNLAMKLIRSRPVQQPDTGKQHCNKEQSCDFYTSGGQIKDRTNPCPRNSDGVLCVGDTRREQPERHCDHGFCPDYKASTDQDEENPCNLACLDDTRSRPSHGSPYLIVEDLIKELKKMPLDSEVRMEIFDNNGLRTRYDAGSVYMDVMKVRTVCVLRERAP